MHSCQLTPHSRVTPPTGAPSPPTCYHPPQDPQQKFSPPMTHKLANDAKQAYVQYKKSLSNV